MLFWAILNILKEPCDVYLSTYMHVAIKRVDFKVYKMYLNAPCSSTMYQTDSESQWVIMFIIWPHRGHHSLSLSLRVCGSRLRPLCQTQFNPGAINVNVKSHCCIASWGLVYIETLTHTLFSSVFISCYVILQEKVYIYLCFSVNLLPGRSGCSCVSWTSASAWCTQRSRWYCDSPAPSVWRRSRTLRSGTAAERQACSVSPGKR